MHAKKPRNKTKIEEGKKNELIILSLASVWTHSVKLTFLVKNAKKAKLAPITLSSGRILFTIIKILVIGNRY